MIWSCDSRGVVNYVGPEWETFTGQPLPFSLRSGWLDMVHPDDRAEVGRIFLEACMQASTFTLQFRLRRRQGDYARVVSGAAPSVSPVDGSFVGFLGALTEVAVLTGDLASTRSVPYLRLPPPVGSTMPHTFLDVVSDHVLLARAAAEKAGDSVLIASLDVSLSLIFVRLGGSRAAH